MTLPVTSRIFSLPQLLVAVLVSTFSTFAAYLNRL